MNQNWKTLDHEDQLSLIDEQSKEGPVIIFKHSTRCGISARSEHALTDGWKWNDEDVQLYYLDLLNYRALSNEIAERYHVVHQSPQMILIKDGKAVDSVTHHAVLPDVVQTWISKSSL